MDDFASSDSFALRQAAAARRDEIVKTEKVKDSWEDEEDEEEEEEEEEVSLPTSSARGAKSPAEPNPPEDINGPDEPLSDPIKEKMRLKKLQEDGEVSIIADTFGGSDTKKVVPTQNSDVSRNSRPAPPPMSREQLLSEAFQKMSLNSLKDVQELHHKLSPKLKEGKAKSQFLYQLVVLILKDLHDSKKLELKDMKNLKFKVDQMVKELEKLERERAAAAKTTKRRTPQSDVREQLDEYYDDYDEDEEEEEALPTAPPPRDNPPRDNPKPAPEKKTTRAPAKKTQEESDEEYYADFM